MPSGDEDVTSSVESSTTESTVSTQELPDANSDGNAEATPQETGGKTPATSAGSAAKASTPDPVAEAIAHLARPEVGAAHLKVEKKPESAPIAQDDVPKEKDPATAKPKSGPTLDDPYAGWLETEQQRNMLKAPTKERINELHRKWKEAETHPDRERGGEFNGLLAKHGLNDDIGYVPPDHLAQLVKVQASINRSLLSIEQGRRPSQTDLQTYQNLRKSMEQFDAKFGLQTTAQTQPSAIEPVQGTLSPEHQDLIDVYGLPEARVRLLAALEQKPNAKTPPPAPVPQAPIQQAPYQQSLPEGPDMEALHIRRLTGVFAKDGISAERMVAYQKALEPTMQNIVAQTFPGIQTGQIPAVYNAMSPKERADIILQAHTEFRKAQTSPVLPKPALAPSTKKSAQRTPMRAQAPTQNLDPVQSAIALLSRPESDE